MDESAFVLLWQFETIHLFIYFHLYHKRNRLLASKKRRLSCAVVLPAGREKFAQSGGSEAARLTEPRAGRNVRYKYSRVGLVIVHDLQEFIRKSAPPRSNGRSAQLVAGSKGTRPPKDETSPVFCCPPPTTSWWRLSRRFLLHATIPGFHS